MMECPDCLSIMKKKNRTKLEQSKKHKNFSGLVLNENVLKDVSVNNFKDE